MAAIVGILNKHAVAIAADSAVTVSTGDNAAFMGAPFASAIVSSSMGVASVYADYLRGETTESGYADATCSLCVEAGIAAVGSAIGQERNCFHGRNSKEI